MSIYKQRITFYMTEQDKSTIKKRASQVGRNMSDYLAELVMWDNRFKVVEHARRGTIKIKDLAEFATMEK